jgi:COP9 signalosome complex subunit 4
MLRFRSAYARILDGERRFLEAAARYIELSNTITDNLTSERDRSQALEFAVTCAILAKAGSQRDALLAKLCADPRCK